MEPVGARCGADFAAEPPSSGQNCPFTRVNRTRRWRVFAAYRRSQSCGCWRAIRLSSVRRLSMVRRPCFDLGSLQAYRNRAERARKNSAGVPMRSEVRCATAFVKSFVLWVSNQSALLAMADKSTGTSALCRIKCRLERTRSLSG